MGLIVVILPCILVAKLNKAKTRFLRDPGYLNSIKTYKARFIANSSSCIVNTLSYCCQKHVIKYYERVYVRSSKIPIWSIKNSGEVLDKLGFNATSLSTYDFSTLYTTLPHKLIKDKHIDLIEKTSKEKVLLTLYVTTETHFHFGKA